MRRLLTVLVPAMLLIPIAADMVSLVLPVIAEEFTASTAQVAWVVTGFLLTMAVGVPIYGRIADRYGLRRLFTVALAVFGAGSLICALAPSLLVLVLGRVVTGAGGAAIPVLAIVAAARLLPRDKTAVGVGFIGAAGGAGAAAGPAVGGVFGQLLGWRALFWIMTVAAFALIPAMRRILNDDAPDDARPFDVFGGMLLGLGAGLLLYGVTQAESAGLGSASSLGTVLGGIVLVALFAWRTRTAAHPFVPPSLFTNRGYVAAVAVIFLAMVVNLATLVLVPILVIDVNGLTPGEGSLVMIPGGLALAVLAPVAGRVGARGANEGTVALIGLGMIGASTLFLSTVAVGASPALAGVAVVGLGAGFAFVVTLATSAVSRVLPPEQVGVGVGIFQAAQFLGAGAGPALFGALLSAREAGEHDALNPLYAHDAPAYSDTFLALTLIALLAMVVALTLRKARVTTPAQPATPAKQHAP
ncbi:MFS transporter [Phytoactinopolyspora halotolerans]|uniref:MFS transporter n=1 Tax=Phytoactinopolyspora halotolerans TaxID=1981512 RepID=A0A6L9SDA5_9ACTN|nr:MFS transporter [Phytoactinopolyspora halotolerans]NEE03049.1 MFS transporter [Phytoactinopolyspora halotolerans]